MFDPYYEWLAIPKDSRPPTYYQLLGISASEQNAKIIETACVRQSTFIRAFQKGAHAEDASRLLSELSEARSTLCDPVRRQAYDQRLTRQNKPAKESPSTTSTPSIRKTLTPNQSSTRIPAKIDPTSAAGYSVKPSPAVEVDETEVVEVAVVRTRKSNKRQNSSNGSAVRFSILIGLIVVCVLGGLLLIRTMGRTKPTERVDPPIQSALASKDAATNVNHETDRTEQPRPDKFIPPKQPPQDPKIEPPKVLQKAEPKPNRQKQYPYLGEIARAYRRTGFVIHEDGLFLTSSWLFREHPKLFYVCVNGRQYKATLLKYSYDLDLALLQLQKASHLPAIKLRARPAMVKGAKTRVLGFSHFGADCESKEMAKGEVKGDWDFTFSKPFDASAMSGPLLDEHGQAIGVISPRSGSKELTSEKFGVVVSSDEILEWAGDAIPNSTNVENAGQAPSNGKLLNAVGMAIIYTSRRLKPLAERSDAGRSPFRSDDTFYQMLDHNLDVIDECIDIIRGGDKREDRKALANLRYTIPVYRNQEVIELTERLIQSESSNVNVLIAYAMFDRPNSFDKVMRLWQTSKIKNEANTLQPFGCTQDPRALNILAKHFDDRELRRQATQGFIRFGEGAEDKVLEILAEAKNDAQRRAVEVLREIGTAKSLEALKEISNSKPEDKSQRELVQLANDAINLIHRRADFRKKDFSIKFVQHAETDKPAGEEANEP